MSAAPAAHIFALCGLALAQPLYDLLGRYPTFFVAHHAARGADLLLFAGVLSLAVPLGLVAFEALVALVAPRLRAVLHLAIVAGLVMLIVLPPLNRVAAPSAGAALAIAAGAGVAAAVVYARLAAVRTFCSVLAAAALAFPLLFLLRMSWPTGDDEGGRAAAAIARPAPMVLIVFDELPLLALLDERGTIDAVRFPHFAALADASIWYRNTTSVADYTPVALPALLSGRLPEHNRLPTAAEHPDTLFTLLGGRYRLHVAEPVTELCPPRLCAGASGPPAAASDRAALFADTLLVWLHMLAPGEWRSGLPDLGRQWTFRFQHWLFTHMLGPSTADRPAAFAAFVDTIEPAGEPTLYFAHVLLPHYRYEYLPSGARYNAPPADFHRERFDPARPVHRLGWAADNAAGAAQEQQRFLLQLALVDRLLGRLVERLRQTGLYDDALLIVTADHGVSFRPGESQRYVTETNHADIMWVPLFVKLPGQRAGRIDDRDVQTIDIVPTVAGVLGVDIPWPHDGRDAGRDAPARDKVVFTPRSLEDQLALERLAFAPALPPLAELAGAQARLFGTGRPPEALFAHGPHPELIGRRPDPGHGTAPAPYTVRLDAAELYRDVRPASGAVPAFIRGRLEPRTAVGDPPALAIAVNGTVAATTRAFVADDRSISFGAVVPDGAFGTGGNTIECYEISTGTGGGAVLRLIRPS